MNELYLYEWVSFYDPFRILKVQSNYRTFSLVLGSWLSSSYYKHRNRIVSISLKAKNQFSPSICYKNFDVLLYFDEVSDSLNRANDYFQEVSKLFMILALWDLH